MVSYRGHGVKGENDARKTLGLFDRRKPRRVRTNRWNTIGFAGNAKPVGESEMMLA